jgi:Domain of unknown function (DUF5134)
MIGLDALRWTLTLAFAGTIVFHLVRWLRRAGPGHEDALHLVMGVAMIVMIWPSGQAVPRGAWIAGFALSAGWFLARAVDSRRLVPLFFATTMGAMVWMTVAAPAGAHAHLHHPRRDWVSAALGAYLVAASVGWVVRGMRLAPAAGSRPPDWPALCHATMSGGMGLALLAMA